MHIDIDKIEVGERLRLRLDPKKLRQLADDMERNGQLQEIVVAIRWGVNSRGATIVEGARLIAGYRRLEAAKLLGWSTIRCTRQLGGELDPESGVDLLRAEYSENELRENFTEMECVAFGVKIKERIAAAAHERMLAGKKAEYEYDPETGYRVWNEDSEPSDESETANADDTDPWVNLPKGTDEALQYTGGRASEFAAKQIGMSDKKFRQGEYVLKHGTEEQQSAIDRGEASISGTYNELRPKQVNSALAGGILFGTEQIGEVEKEIQGKTQSEVIAPQGIQLKSVAERGETIENLKRKITVLTAMLEKAQARVKELEEKYEPNRHTI